MSQNAIPAGASDVAARIAERTLSRRSADYSSEVRRLLDAALDVMRRCGTEARPRVADIVTAAGLSNEAFYRHFPSKDALVVALLDDGADRLHGYLSHQIAKERTAPAKVRRWVEGVLSQADGDVAATTLAVLWNAGGAGEGTAGRHFAATKLSTLLHEPFAELGSREPQLHAALAAHAVLGRLSDHLWARTRPKRAEVDSIVRFCVATASSGRGSTRARR